MILTRALADRCRARNLRVNEMPGWLARGETDGPFSVRGVILHHDGEGLNNANVPNYMCQDGVNGAQLWVAKDGCVWFLAAGRKWHAGTGPGWRNIPANHGNDVCVGIETDHTDGQAWTAAQMVAIVVLTQEICVMYYIDVDQWCCGHREYAPGRKPDPENFDLDAWRAAVKSGGGITAGTNDDDLDGWLDMGAKEEILDALKNRTEGSQSVYDELRYAINNVVLPAIAAVDARVTALQNLLFQPDTQTPGHSVREEVQWAAINQVVPMLTAILEGHPDLTPAPRTYCVQPGDTLFKIAAQNGVTVADLVTWNQLPNADTISVGQELELSPERR